mmetsp:Transcript_15141/g.34759  ORF Transcript_15141/g.34759 Transcript_15141/m.34759 type:complete len:115 (+) Transcript_15141:1205-1549(+)
MPEIHKTDGQGTSFVGTDASAGGRAARPTPAWWRLAVGFKVVEQGPTPVDSYWGTFGKYHDRWLAQSFGACMLPPLQKGKSLPAYYNMSRMWQCIDHGGHPTNHLTPAAAVRKL